MDVRQADVETRHVVVDRVRLVDCRDELCWRQASLLVQPLLLNIGVDPPLVHGSLETVLWSANSLSCR